MLGDPSRRGVELDARDPSAFRSLADEVARPAPGLEDFTSVEPEPGDRVPHRGNDGVRGVVGVERRSPRSRPLVLGEEAANLVVVRIRYVEHIGQGAPARPPGEDDLVVGSRGALFDLEAAKRVQRREVGGELGGATRRREVGLGPRPEGRTVGI